MAVTVNTRAIILRRDNWRENDKRVTFYSRDYGKMEAAVIGAAKITSKLAGHLEPAREVELMLAKGKTIDKVGQAVTIDDYLKNASFESYWYASQAARLVDALTKTQQNDFLLFELLKKFLSLVKNDLPAARWPKLWCAFCLKLLTVLGYRPELDHCGVCKKKFQPVTNYFSPRDNLFICIHCQPADGLAVSAEVLKISRFGLSQPFDQVTQLQLTPKLLSNWRKLVEMMVKNYES